MTSKNIGRDPGTAIDSPELREVFLQVLRDTGNVGTAAKVINVYRTTPYQWRKKDPEFAKKWDEAMDVAADLAEAEVRKRAIEGFDEPVFYQGKVVGHVKKYSDRMLELYIKALKPEKFRERNQPEGAVIIQVNGIDDIKSLRESNPWGSDSVEKKEIDSFKPATIEVEEIPDDRTGTAIKAGRKSGYKVSKKGMLPSDEDHKEEDD